MIKAPNFAKDAIPTLKGWVSPKGELLVARKFTQEQIEEYLNKDKPKAKKGSIKRAIFKLTGKK